MQFLKQRKAQGILLASLLFGQVLMIGQQVQTIEGGTRLRYWSSSLMLPVLKGAQATAGAVVGSWGRYVWLVGAGRENRRLGAEADRLRLENHFLRQELLRFQARAELDAYRERLASCTLPARVIASGPSRTAREVFLDRGRSDKVQPGMAVVGAHGIVGKVHAAYASSSMVLLLNDSESGVGVVLAGSGEPGILRGTGGRLCRLEYIGPHIRVEAGEAVYTSGLDGVYAGGLPVGRVETVEGGVKALKIQVRPHANLDRLDSVLIVLRRELEVLPAQVQRALRRRLPTAPDATAEGPGADLGRASARTAADRIKRAYRSAVESQGRAVGQLGYRGHPDFSGAAALSRQEGGERAARGEPFP